MPLGVGLLLALGCSSIPHRTSQSPPVKADVSSRIVSLNTPNGTDQSSTAQPRIDAHIIQVSAVESDVGAKNLPLDNVAPTDLGSNDDSQSARHVVTPESSSTNQDVLTATMMTLDEAVTWGLRDNPRLRQMSAYAAAAQAGADVAFAPFLPDFGASFRYSGFNLPVLPGGSFVPASLSAGVTSFTIAEMGVQYTITDFGRRSGRYGQAIHRAAIEAQASLRARQSVAFEVAQNYFRLLSAEATLRVAEESMRDAERILADTKARRDGGVAEKESVLRAEVELSQTKQFHLSAIQGVSDARSILNVSMGRSAEQPLRISEVAAQPSFTESLEDSLSRAIAERHEIRMAREAVAEASAGVQAAKGEQLPKVYVRGTVLRADSPGPINGFIEGAGIHVDQPIYAGGKYRAEIRRSEAQVAAAHAGLQVILDNVSLQVSVAYQAIETDRQRIQLGEVTVAQARENLRLMTVRYDNGNATPTDIVDAQTSLRQAETTYYTAIFGYLEGLARLEYAVGGDQERLLERFRQAETPRAMERVMEVETNDSPELPPHQ